MSAAAENPEAVVDRLLDGVERGDVAAVAACYAPGAKIWHNFDEHEQTVDENLALLAALVGVLSERKYTVRERIVVPGGVIQQHDLDGVLPDGTKYHLPACILFKVKDGRVTRIDEYFDSAHFAPLLKLLPEM
jgi:ketosteroid isomerase-like protein